MNFTRSDLDAIVGLKTTQDLHSLFETGEMVLTISYWSGFFISSFNFIIFSLACVLYMKVGVEHKN